MPGPLAGVRILDVTTVVLGPWAAQMLGDMGADVVKVEPPEGDTTRRLGPARLEHVAHASENVLGRIRSGDMKPTPGVVSLILESLDTIKGILKTIEQATGKRPRGWLGAGLIETYNTLDILAEEGVNFCGDWNNDDQPYPMKVKSGRSLRSPTATRSTTFRSTSAKATRANSISDR